MGRVVEEYRSEFLDGLVGQVALVKQLTGPHVDEELLDKFEEDPLTGKVETLRSRTALRRVVGYDELAVSCAHSQKTLKVFPFSYRGVR